MRNLQDGGGSLAATFAFRSNDRRARAVTLLVSGGFFMEMLDGTIITTALPQIGHSFGVSAVALGIAMTAYLLALAVFIPISGALLLNVSSSLHSHSFGIPGKADFRIALFATAIVALFGLIDSVMLDADAGRSISGHRR